ncbi:putative methyltransferase-domain-containing protein [Desarmillaria tabescens]|uniref:Methyltransferase-domain-containing protein n=1 Tax=Armillaria tabescens TaxID=1929756 RepID=A0AA39NI84_ARMTA|nr:putative methyltransferase-domain-containing protein [Desarmillaria tabescens]KAK0466128.1 putative methyltransferase-domain-containing protein [Desarmillaria tabescens]
MSHIILPTAFLPPLARLRTFSGAHVSASLRLLRDFYWPSVPSRLTVPVRKASTRIHDQSVPDSGYASAEEDDDEEEGGGGGGGEESDYLTDEDEDVLRADPFEREFAIKWITGFISRSDIWIEDTLDEAEAETRRDLIVSAFAGDDEETECAVTRTFEFSGSVEVELNDAPLSSEDHTSVGLQSWASSILLAEKMCASPGAFGLDMSRPLRVLELGAGTGLLSITIVATDYHPDVLANLSANVQTNFPCSSSTIDVRRFDWESPDFNHPMDKPFDIILAADVIYHAKHAEWIKGCVEQLLALNGTFWLMIPLRSTGRHEGMDHTVEAVFPESEMTSGLVVLEKETIGRQGGVGRADEGGYKLFKIGWAI